MKTVHVAIFALGVNLGSLSYTLYTSWRLEKLKERWHRIEEATEDTQPKLEGNWQSLCLDEENTRENIISYIPCDSLEARAVAPKDRI